MSSSRPSSARSGAAAAARPRHLIAVALVAVALAAGACTTPPPPPPNPTVVTTVVPAGNGFGGGTIYRRSDLAGRVGAVAIAPGFTADQSSIDWYGPLLAQRGLIVFTIDTNSQFDQPSSRATQLLAALDYLSTTSAVAGNVDTGRLAVMGWSMGGGGALEAAVRRPSLKAAIPLAPWHTTNDFPTTVPTLVVACENDAVAWNGTHSIPFYNSIPATTPKAYLEIAGGSHSCVTEPNDTVAAYVVPWVLRFVNGDAGAGATLCPAPIPGGPISAYEANCPYS